MSLRLAFDLDGVFADLGAHLTNGSTSPLPDDATDEGSEPQSASDLDQREAPPVGQDEPSDSPFGTTHLRGGDRKTWDRLAAIENFWETLEEIEPGAVRKLGEVAKARRWEVIFLTSRPNSEGDSVQLQSQRWLEQKGFPLPSVFVTRGSRGRIAAALSLDLVVDDNPENCLDIAMESKARAILVWRGTSDMVPSSARRLGIGSVTSVAECITLIEEVDRTRHGGDRRGFFSAFKRLLGLGETA